MIRRSTIVVILFAIIVAAIVGYNQFVKTQPPLEINIVTDPLAEDWIRAAAEAFNKTDTLVNNGTTRVRVNVMTAVYDVAVWTATSGWTFDRHPLVWIPSSSASLQYIPSNLPFKTLQPSLARTPLVWGGFRSRVDVITANGSLPFDWTAVNNVLKAGRWANTGASGIDGNVNMAINQPETSMAGLAVLISGTADLNDTTTLNRSHISGTPFETWLQPLSDAVRNMRNKGGSPAELMASEGGRDFGLLPESQWLLSLGPLTRKEPIVFSYPAYQFVLDFPMALWDDTTTTGVQRQAAAAFGDYLISAEGQQTAPAYGLRPANSEPDTTAALFQAGLPSGIQLEPAFGQIIAAPARNESETLLRAMD